MNKLFYYFASKKLLMAQAKDLQRQWQEMRDERDMFKRMYYLRLDSHIEMVEEHRLAGTSLRDQLHRVARERDNERKLRLEAEKLRDVYLEQLENEEE